MVEVSVVIPTHNRRELLIQAVASVRSQTMRNLEIVVVDDGSTDDTTSALSSISDVRLRVIHLSEARGVSHARNRGIRAATGQWISFLDDDDLWSPEKLARQLQAARETGRCWACSGSVTVDAALRVIAGSPPPAPDVIADTLPIRNCVPAGASNVVVARQLLNAAGEFDERLRHLADWDLWIRLASRDLPAVVPFPDVAYRLHGSNASDDAEAIDGELNLIAERHASARDGREIDRAFVLRWAAWNLLRVGRRGAAARMYAKAAAQGDPASAARAFAAVLDPSIVQRRLGRALDHEFAHPTSDWLADFRRKTNEISTSLHEPAATQFMESRSAPTIAE